MTISAFLSRRHTWQPYQRASRSLKRLIGEHTFDVLQKTLRQSNAAMPLLSKPEKIEAKGVNMLGLFSSESGLGQAARGYVKALDAASIASCLLELSIGDHRRVNRAYANRYASRKEFDVTIIHINGDFVRHAYEAHQSWFKNSYCIGIWTWELACFPDQWKQSLNLFHELWVPSTFVQKAIQLHSPIPVYVVPHVVEEFIHAHDRKHFGMNPDAFALLSMIDFHSVMERKNPIGSIRAFKKAFPCQSDVQLIVKCLNAERYPWAYADVIRAIENDPRIVVISKILSKEEAGSLIHCCDVFASLHRSEGFGLALAEAMNAGKPVIATNYGGNTDFMNSSNSLLVPYSIVTLPRTYGPYGKGSAWAEPSIELAAHSMQSVYGNRAEGRMYGAQARATIQSEFGAQRIGLMIKERLKRI